MCELIFLHIAKSEKCKYTRGEFSLKVAFVLRGFFKLWAAYIMMLCSEIWCFQVPVMLANLLENPERALGCSIDMHDRTQICIHDFSWI